MFLVNIVKKEYSKGGPRNGSTKSFSEIDP